MKMYNDDYLVSKDDKLREDEINDLITIDSNYRFLELQQRVIEEHKKCHDTLLIVNCSSVKPYIKSKYIKKYYELYGDKVDIAITTAPAFNLIPLEYCNCYPFNSYNVPKEENENQYSAEKRTQRIIQFLKKHDYKKVIIYLSKKYDDYKDIMKSLMNERLLEKLNIKSKIYFLPTDKAYELLESNRKKEGKSSKFLSYYNLLSPECLGEIEEVIENG